MKPPMIPKKPSSPDQHFAALKKAMAAKDHVAAKTHALNLGSSLHKAQSPSMMGEPSDQNDPMEAEQAPPPSVRIGGLGNFLNSSGPSTMPPKKPSVPAANASRKAMFSKMRQASPGMTGG